MSGIPIQGTLYENAVGAPLARLDNIPEMVWDGPIPFSTIYANANIATLINGITIVLKGTGHTIDNKGSIYNNMQCVAFDSLDNLRIINIADGATINYIPSLLNKVVLQSQSTSFVCVNPFLSSAQIVYIGRICALQCDSSVSGVKFISLTENNQLVTSYVNGNIVNANVFDLADTSTLQIAIYNNCYVDTTSFSGTASTNLVLIYLNNFDVFSPPYKSLFTNFLGNIYYVPISDANQLRNVAYVTWDSTVGFADFYALQNISSLTGLLIITLTGTGDHIIDMGTYTNLNLVWFNAGTISKNVLVSEGVTFTSVPNLMNNVQLISYSSVQIATNPDNSGTWYIGPGSSFGVHHFTEANALGISITNMAFSITLDNASIGNVYFDEVIRVQTTGILNVTIINDQNLVAFEPKTFYGTGGGVINVQTNGAFELPLNTAYTNFIGTINNTYFGDTHYTNATPTPVTIGGIPSGSTFSVQKNADMWTALLYPYQYPAFTSFSISGQATTIEVGTSISGAHTFVWATSNNSNIETNTINIYDITGSITLFTGLANDGSESYSFPSPIQLITQDSYVWQIEGTNTHVPSTTFNKNFTVNWEWRMHSGTSVNATLTNAQILALANSSLATVFPPSVNFAGGDTYFWYWIPDSFIQPTIFRDLTTGFQIDMESPVIQSVTNVNSIATNYKGYRSTYQLAVGTTVGVS